MPVRILHGQKPLCILMDEEEGGKVSVPQASPSVLLRLGSAGAHLQPWESCHSQQGAQPGGRAGAGWLQPLVGAEKCELKQQ